MSTINPIPPSIPFHIARAYGIQPALNAARGGGVQAAAPVASIEATQGPAAKLPNAAQRLVGATVPGRVDFSGEQPVQAAVGGGSGAIQMYRHPADRNAAATAVQIGRSLDVSG